MVRTREEAEKGFLELLFLVKQYLKENPKHVGTIAKTQKDNHGNAIGRKLYELAYIRRTKGSSRNYGRQHFELLDQVLPGWDQYKSVKGWNFEKFIIHYKKFIDQRNAYYDTLGIPLELRDLHVPELHKQDGYVLGLNMQRIKAGFNTTTEDQIKQIAKINKYWNSKLIRFDLPTFYMHFKKYIDQKNEFFDSINLPQELRDYRMGYNVIVDGYNLRQRFETLKDVWPRLTKKQKSYFLALDPEIMKPRSKKYDAIEVFAQYSKFLKQKNQFYEKLEVPENLRTYYVAEDEMVGEYPLAEKLEELAENIELSEEAKQYLGFNNPAPDQNIPFDFGEFYGYVKKFYKERNLSYDKLNVPQEKRKYTIFDGSCVGNYTLGYYVYRIKKGQIKLTDLQKAYLKGINPIDPQNSIIPTLKTQEIERA